MQLNATGEQRLERLHIFLMEQVVKQYRKMATQYFREHKAGISVDHWVILKRISENDGCSQVEVAESTVKDAPSMTRYIDKLVNEKLIVKQLDPEDRRRYMLFITDKGRQLIDRLLPIVQEYRARATQGFSETEKKTLIALLQRMHQNLSD
jgi:DNA-binding MarR family transcriptional regulator